VARGVLLLADAGEGARMHLIVCVRVCVRVCMHPWMWWGEKNVVCTCVVRGGGSERERGGGAVCGVCEIACLLVGKVGSRWTAGCCGVWV